MGTMTSGTFAGLALVAVLIEYVLLDAAGPDRFSHLKRALLMVVLPLALLFVLAAGVDIRPLVRGL